MSLDDVVTVGKDDDDLHKMMICGGTRECVSRARFVCY
jgi:hypothetical protein